MAQETLERIVEDLKTLTPQEQQQLRLLLDRNVAVSSGDAQGQQRLLERLLEKGVIGSIPPRLDQEEAGDFHAPIEVRGRPVSETLLEDRA